MQKVALVDNADHHAGAVFLAALLGGDQRAPRHAPMQEAGSSAKYITVHEPIADEQLVAHIAGEATYAAVLIGRDGKARAWAVDFDHGGAELVRRAVAALSAAGLPCRGQAVRGAGEHDGGHVWGRFAVPVEPAHARAYIKGILEAAGLPSKEVWPCGVNIRLPLGMHRWTGKRGLLIRPQLPDVDLDEPGGLAVGLEAFASLEASPAPPEPAPVPRPAPEPRQQPARATSRPRAGRTDGGKVIARFNAEHSLKQMLEHDGATLADPENDLYYCPCGAHSSGTPSLQIVRSSDPARYGEYVAWSYSPNCRVAPHQSERKPLDAFDYFTQKEHGGDRTAALKAYNPIAPRPAEQPVEEGRPAPDPATVAARRRDAARKREARRAEAEGTLQAVRDRACEDAELVAYPTAAAVLRELLTLAGTKTWCRPSVAGLAARLAAQGLERSERTIQRALAWLEGRYIAAEQQVCPDGRVQPLGSRPGKPRSTAVRTFLREPRRPTETPQTAETGVTRADAGESPGRTSVSPDHVHEHDLVHALERVSGAPGDPGPLDDDGWAALLGEAPPAAEDLVDPAAVAAWELEAGLCEVPAEALQPAPGEAELLERPPVAVSFEGGASFDPAAPTPATDGRRLPDPRDPRGLGNWRLLCELWAAHQPAEGQVDDLVEPFAEEEPLVKGPPRDPAKASEYYKLRGKAQRAASARQKRYLLRLAAELEEWRPVGELPPRAAPPAAASRASPHASPRRASPAPSSFAQAALFPS